jgi:hypothetical protein
MSLTSRIAVMTPLCEQEQGGNKKQKRCKSATAGMAIIVTFSTVINIATMMLSKLSGRAGLHTCVPKISRSLTIRAAQPLQTQPLPHAVPLPLVMRPAVYEDFLQPVLACHTATLARIHQLGDSFLTADNGPAAADLQVCHTLLVEAHARSAQTCPC